MNKSDLNPMNSFMGLLDYVSKRKYIIYSIIHLRLEIYMSKRYRISRSIQDNNNPTPEGITISLEECKQYFAAKADFTYSSEI